jgi:predicted enzyme related to lactoylglutathione lyase
MAEFAIPTHGTICWQELATKDLPAAKDFYKEMFGWNLEQSKIAPMEYSEIHFGGKAVGGMMQIDERFGDPPPPSHWTTYIAAENADETVAKIKENGGGVKQEPFDVPGVGRMAFVSDPSGAPFAIIQFEKP